MDYVLLLHDDEKRWEGMPEQQYVHEMGAYAAYTRALQEARIFVDGNPLQPTTTATVVRVTSDGKTTVLDGPYAETKEQLGGYYIIRVPDLDAAISWAARCPCANTGTVEIRPVADLPEARP